ncbi:MAG: hypothetical protein ACOYNL_05660 [Rickettsiales bacterium]
MTETKPQKTLHTTLQSESFAGREDVRVEYGRGDGTHIPRTVETKNRERNTQDSSYQSYLFGSAGTDEHPAWSDSAKGRAIIRIISRGLVGAAFFTIGGRMAEKQLVGYTPEKWEWSAKKPLQAIAKLFDVSLGRGIEKSVTALSTFKHSPEVAAQIGKQAVTFRNSKIYDGTVAKGRSYGADVVGFTFDFAMASIGDASTRNIIQALDPNVKKTWFVNDDGRPALRGESKHFVFSEWVKAVGKTSWRILSKNQGEDWAAAIPYAFQMKYQRQALGKIFNKQFDGHQIAFDNSWNGGAYRVNSKNQIVGDYQLAGAIDLHARFVGYNWYTLMFREGYDVIGSAFKKWKDDGFAIHPHLPDANPITAAVDGIGATARYVAKSFIKANLYMNPSVIPFWLFRVPQSKWRSNHVIDADNRGQLVGREFNIDLRNEAPTNITAGRLNPYDSNNYHTYANTTWLDKLEKRFSQTLSPFGQLSNYFGKRAAQGGAILSKNGFASSTLGDEKFMRQYVDAAFSYTPYMYAKAEFGLRVDDSKGPGQPGQMDKAIYRFMDNIASFNLNGTGKSIKEIWTLGTNFEREVVAREGGHVPDVQVVAAIKPAGTPATKVEATSIMRHAKAPASSWSQAANDSRWTKTPVTGNVSDKQTSANDEKAEQDRSWVQSIVGSDIHPARVHSASPTRH